MEPSDKPSIVSVLTHYGFEFPHFMRSGGTKVRCAFHGDRIDSAVVNQVNQSVVCFACGRKGDSVKIIQDEEGLSFRDALAFAAEQGWYEGADVPAFQPRSRRGRKKRAVRSVRRRRRSS